MMALSEPNAIAFGESNGFIPCPAYLSIIWIPESVLFIE
jgi:hypothetical protein